MKKLLVAALAVLLAAAAGAYVIVVRPLVAPAAQTIAAEAALATPDLVLLAALNVRQMVFLERWLLGAPVIRAVDARAPRALDERSLLDHLAAARVDLRRDVEHVLYGLYPATERGARHAIVIVGRFDPGDIERYLVAELGGIPRPVGGRTAYEVRRVDPDRCDHVTTWMITADANWILIGDAAAHDLLVSRLTQIPPADEAELAWWRALAHSDLVSIGMWRPREADKSVSGPLLKMSAQAVLAQTVGVEHVYLGLGAKTVPPSGRLRLVLDAADGAGIQQKVDEWRRALQQSREAWAQTAPSLAPLLDSVSVKSSGNRETIEFTVDRTFASNLERAVSELLASIFAGLGGGREPGARPSVRAERIDTEAIAFTPAVDAAGLAAYDAAAMFAEDVDQVHGPFGVRLGAMRVPSVSDSGPELDVEAFAGAVPNLAGGGERARLFVDSVMSITGQEVLRPEPCGRQRNGLASTFTDSGGRRLRATKTVRLLAGADPRTVGTIAGHVELRLPTRVETQRAARPTPGATLAAHGATVTITKVDGGDVQYQITGARDRVLAVRALNAAGQSLASEMKMSSDFLFGDGSTARVQYAGIADTIEATFVVSEQSLRWPFRLTDLSMTGGKPGMPLRPTTPDFRPYSVQALRRDVLLPNPFELSLEKAHVFFNTRLEFKLRSPMLPNFEHAFTVGRLAVKRIELKDGTALTPPTPQQTTVRFGGSPRDGLLTTSLYVFVDSKIPPESIKAVAGVLTMQFPRSIRTLRMDELFPGQRAETAGLAVTVTARGRRALTLQTGPGGERLLYVMLTDADLQPVMSFSPSVSEEQDGTWRFQLTPQGVAAHADVLVAGDLDRKEYPFRLELK